ncbi:MAG TPA: PIN domain-containing protein [Allocoleopsis sp.]
MRVLVDTNIVLDFLLEREPFLQDAEALFDAIGSGRITGYVTATTLTDIFYIARRQTQDIERARQAVSITLAVMEICPVDRAVLEIALTLAVTDFEDAVQLGCALAQGLDAIVTRDADFASTLIRVSPVSEILQQLEFPER